MEQIYEVVISCDNCGELITLGIDKGEPREEFIVGLICPNCECEMLEPEWVMACEGGEE